MRTYISPSHISSGFIAVLVGYTSSAVIIFQAASAAGASTAEVSSWLWALGIGMGVTCIGLSLAFRAPILTAWSTPGAALLVTALAGVPMGDAVGAFLFSSALITLCGLLGWFDVLMKRIPRALAGAMLAGILVRFGLDVFTSLGTQPVLVGTMLATYLFGRRLLPRYAVPLTLLCGIFLASAQGLVRFDSVHLEIAYPVFISPTLSLTALIGVGLPLFIVTMASQNIPGIAVLRANGYKTPASPLITWTGLTGMILAPFGGFAFNLAAITAAICMSPDADPKPERRYLASLWAGVFYLITGLLGATVAGLFAAFPSELVMSIAGLALISTIANSLAGALAEPAERDAALITFLITASGLTLFGVGSAFWGLVLGVVARHILRERT